MSLNDLLMMLHDMPLLMSKLGLIVTRYKISVLFDLMMLCTMMPQ